MDLTRSRNSAGLPARSASAEAGLPDKARSLAGRTVAAVFAALLAAVPVARAQVNITAAQTTPISTATANNGAPSDVVITSSGSVTPSNASAVTINSNNSVTNAGSITISNANGVAGILAHGGNTGTITNTGTISITDSAVGTAEPFVPNTSLNRYGIRVDGTTPFTGTISQTAGSITVQGDASAGIDVEAGLNLPQNAGTIAVTGSSILITGDNSYGILTNGSITGGINFTGTITALGAGTTGIQLNQSVGTQVYINGTITATGFSSTARPTSAAGFQALTAANLAIGGNAVNVANSVGQGIEVDTAGVVGSAGSAAALEIASPNGSTTIGVNPNGVAGLQILGAVQATGVYDNFNATGIQIGGPVTVNAGTKGSIDVAGSVTATAFAANATGIAIGAGASVPSIVNTGTISSTVQFGQGGNATVGGNATAISDSASVSPISITNQGTISATSAAGRAIAIDFSGSNASQITVTQSASQTATPAVITGDILFGSGNATLNLGSGVINGSVAFGSGANNIFNITGGTTMVGGLTNAGGLALNALGGRLELTNIGTVSLSSLNIGNAGQIDFAVDGGRGQSTEFVVGATTISSGAKIGLDFVTKATGPETFTIVQSQTFTSGSSAPTLGDVPFFYNVALATSPNGTVAVTVSPRTASQAGITVGSAAFNAIFNAFDRDPTIESTFNRAVTGQAFSHVYEQMLPDYAGGLFQALLDGTDALTRAELGSPIYPAPGNRTGAWLEEFGFAVDRSRDQAPGYHGGGLGFALGWENPLSKLTRLGYAVSYMRGSVNDVDSGPNTRAVGTAYAFGAYLKRDLSDVGQGLKADAAINIGYAPLNSRREFDGTDPSGASFVRTATAKWSGAVGNAHLGLSYEENLGDFFVRPHVAGDFFALYEGDRQERNGGSAFDLSIASKTSTEGSGEVGLTIGTEFGSDFIWRPQITVGWKQIFGGPDNTVAQFASGGQSFTLVPQALDRGGYFGRFEMHGGDHYTDVSFQAGGETFGDYHAFDGRFTARFRF